MHSPLLFAPAKLAAENLRRRTAQKAQWRHREEGKRILFFFVLVLFYFYFVFFFFYFVYVFFFVLAFFYFVFYFFFLFFLFFFVADGINSVGDYNSPPGGCRRRRRRVSVCVPTFFQVSRLDNF